MELSDEIKNELAEWKEEMNRRPRFRHMVAKKLQTRINKIIPEKVHVMITEAIKQMTKAVYFGAGIATPAIAEGPVDLEIVEQKVQEKIKFYSGTAAAEGAVTGAGGILLGLADFPLWLTVKSKMLFDIAALYGRDTNDYKERLYILYIFELAFSSRTNRRKIFPQMETWDEFSRTLPENIDEFDWRRFQQEYRDYIDLAKFLQLMPGIGAPIGAIVNLRLTRRLGKTAMNAYRMRLATAA